MGIKGSLHEKLAAFGIAALCFGYFATYVPYSMMTKMITKGLFAGMNGEGLAGFELQPIAFLANIVALTAFFSLAGWWKHAKHSTILGVSIPRPRWYTFLSGLCTGGVIMTTTIAYTFDGISIVFAMLLMRGGVLIMGPIVDTIARKRKRRIYWPSWVAALLSLGALIAAFASKASTAITAVAAIDILLYLGCYFVRFMFMSNRAKSDDQSERKGFVVEEQMTASPFMFLGLLIVGLIGSKMDPSSIPGLVWKGFTSTPFSGYFWYVYLIGTFSYGTGLFGTLILLDKRENTFTIPANRVSSIIAGVIATYALAILYGQRYPSAYQLIGVALVLAAIIFLSYRSIVEKRAKLALVKQVVPATEAVESSDEMCSRAVTN
jgi:uncharacterized membrane protein YdcZ (DUF606 family)